MARRGHGLRGWIEALIRFGHLIDPVRFMVPTPGLAEPSAPTQERELEPGARSPVDEVPEGLAEVATVPEVETSVEVSADPFLPIDLPHGLRITFAATCPKDAEMPETNEDAWALHSDSGSVAIFDGATESFAARRWVRILVDQFTQDGALNLDAARTLYALTSEAPLSWAQEAAAGRGSFTTVAAYFPAAEQILIVGDSAVIDVMGDEIVGSWPYSSAEEFASTPEALGSAPELQSSDDILMSQGLTDIPVPDRPDETRHLLLATDAVAAWLLAESRESRAERVRAALACATEQDWVALVQGEREGSQMKVDDSTLVVLALQ